MGRGDLLRGDCTKERKRKLRLREEKTVLREGKGRGDCTKGRKV